MKRGAGSWVLSGLAWAGAFLAIAGIESYQVSRHPEGSRRVDWLFVFILSSALAAAVVMVVRRIRSRPSAAQKAALAALLHEAPGTTGAVVVMKEGTPEVIATVRNREEYLELLRAGRLPEDHQLFLTDDS